MAAAEQTHPTTTVNVEKLKKELWAARREEESYQRENDAKFRAIRQKVASYEEFRDIVKAAHLKPVDRTARASAPASHPWNTATSGGEQPEVREESSASLVTDVPTNQQEFLRAWRGCAAEGIKRYGLLLRLGAEGLERVFPVESSMQLLGDILVALNEEYSHSDSAAVTGILDHLSHTQRFSLSMSFLSATEKASLAELLDKMSAPDELRGTYGMPARCETSLVERSVCEGCLTEGCWESLAQ